MICIKNYRARPQNRLRVQRFVSRFPTRFSAKRPFIAARGIPRMWIANKPQHSNVARTKSLTTRIAATVLNVDRFGDQYPSPCKSDVKNMKAPSMDSILERTSRSSVRTDMAGLTLFICKIPALKRVSHSRYGRSVTIRCTKLIIESILGYKFIASYGKVRCGHELSAVRPT
jgi:hypothetical protein